jgi:hypothetical protein
VVSLVAGVAPGGPGAAAGAHLVPAGGAGAGAPPPPGTVDGRD